MKLRTYLTDNLAARFMYDHPRDGEVIGSAEDVAAQFSAYLDCEVVEDGSAVFFEMPGRRLHPACVRLAKGQTHGQAEVFELPSGPGEGALF